MIYESEMLRHLMSSWGAVFVNAADNRFGVDSDNKDMVSISDEGLFLIVKNTTGYELLQTGGTDELCRSVFNIING